MIDRDPPPAPTGLLALALLLCLTVAGTCDYLAKTQRAEHSQDCRPP